MIDFLGIGAQKAGTTWLYEWLRRHPDILFPAGKEVHFWDKQHHRGVDYYVSLFERSSTYLSRIDVKVGEITPAYAILPPKTIGEIRDVNAALRIVYIIRNPEERAWSSAVMALHRAELQIHEASDQWFIDHFHSDGSLRRGNYESCIRNWRTVFPGDALLVLRFDDLVNEPRDVLRQCFAHIGVSAEVADEFAEEELRVKVFRSAPYPLRPCLRPVLHGLYADKVHRLSEYLGMDLSTWLNSPA